MKKLHLRDRNPEVVAAWSKQFADLVDAGRVDVSRGDIFDGPAADAIVSPANCFGYMDGGIDLAYLARFGTSLQDRLQGVIRERFHGELHIGQAVLVPTGDVPIAWLVSAPTMRVPMNVARTTNAYTAFRAALAAVLEHNRASPKNRIDELLCPGLCTAIGGMSAALAARQMRFAWDTVIDGKLWIRPGDARASQRALLETE